MALAITAMENQTFAQAMQELKSQRDMKAHSTNNADR